jgi:hypothetical protein
MNVYNLSDMTKLEAENLLTVSEGRLCVRFYRREDGTVLTADCPVGLRAARLRLAAMTAALAGYFFAFLYSVGLEKVVKSGYHTDVSGNSKGEHNPRLLPTLLMGAPPAGDYRGMRTGEVIQGGPKAR